ncbi:DUF2294 domain-containing protein [Patescibacteria group bacterium]|nr:DUF2294 domain-containing protein [Patescibacteria group bacterium]MCL5091810.1 DUF2294 domain-containing protein [Patescibacteria group bacterium]
MNIRPTTQGQIEDQISKELSKFYVKTLGVGPKQVRTYIIDDMIVIRAQSQLLPIERHLLAGADGIELVKNMRKTLHELTTKQFNKTIKRITNHEVIGTHSDISTKTGDRVEIFILDTNYQKELESALLREG